MQYSHKCPLFDVKRDDHLVNVYTPYGHCVEVLY